MDVLITSQINDLNGEIAALRAEIDQLEIERNELDKHASSLDNSEPHVDSTEVITHVPFDSLVAEFFGSNSLVETVEAQKENLLPELKNNILYENMLRIGGITAFPVNDHTLGSEKVLGIRLDNFSHKSHKFLLPHYVILRAITDKSGEALWEVWRHTLPVFIPLQEYSKELPDLDKFVRLLRRHLVLVQYKHDKFDLLGEQLQAKVVKDLLCEHVKVEIESVTFDLKCLLDQVELVTCTDNDKKHWCSMLRSTPFQKLLSQFKKVIDDSHKRRRVV